MGRIFRHKERRKKEQDKIMQKILEKTYKNRFWITLFTLSIFAGITFGVGYALFHQTAMPQEWKEVLFLILGAFIGSYQRVIDFWFNNIERDKEIMYRADAEDGRLAEDIAPRHDSGMSGYSDNSYDLNINTGNNATPDGVCNCMCEGCRLAHNKGIDGAPLAP